MFADADTAKMLRKAFAMSQENVYNLFQDFKEGRERFNDSKIVGWLLGPYWYNRNIRISVKTILKDHWHVGISVFYQEGMTWTVLKRFWRINNDFSFWKQIHYSITQHFNKVSPQNKELYVTYIVHESIQCSHWNLYEPNVLILAVGAPGINLLEPCWDYLVAFNLNLFMRALREFEIELRSTRLQSQRNHRGVCHRLISRLTYNFLPLLQWVVAWLSTSCWNRGWGASGAPPVVEAGSPRLPAHDWRLRPISKREESVRLSISAFMHLWICVQYSTHCWPVWVLGQAYSVGGCSTFRDCRTNKAGRGVASCYRILCRARTAAGIVCARSSTAGVGVGVGVGVFHRTSLCAQFLLTSPFCTSVREPNLIKENFIQWETDKYR